MEKFFVHSCFIHATSCSFNVLGSILFFPFLWSSNTCSDHGKEDFAMAVVGPKVVVLPNQLTKQFKTRCSENNDVVPLP